MLHFFKFLVSKVFLVNLLIALLLLSGGLYATLNYLEDYTLHGKSMEVPNLINYQLEEAKDVLSESEAFSAVVNDSIFKKGVPGGTILDQNPKGGKTVKQDRKIYLSIAAVSPPMVDMPNLVDLSLRQATALMETYSFEVGKLTYKPDLCRNCILEQLVAGVKIEAGDKIERGATVDLVVGQGLGNELTSVPYLIEFNTSLAEELLKTKSLNLGGVLYDESVQSAEDTLAALVYKQIPFYSEAPIARMGSAVDIYLTVDTNRIVHTVNPTDSL